MLPARVAYVNYGWKRPTTRPFRSPVITIDSSRPNLDSPLRYPGGKSSLTGFLTTCVGLMPSPAVTYVEPYAGGAGAGISLLVRNRIARLVINDLDPAVHSFWRAVLEESARFVERIQSIPLTLSEWDRQKSIYRAGRRDRWFELGFAFFYLNRTNRSGVLNAGVIGGRAQAGRYKIDARFNRDQLVERVRSIEARADRIELHCADGRRLIETFATVPDALIYADPPYVQMGGSLYLNAFTELDHELLATCLHRNRDAWWVLTYDNSPLVRSLYGDCHLGEYRLHWSAGNKGMSNELFALSDPLAAALREHSS